MGPLTGSPVGHQAVLGSRCPLFILLKLPCVVYLNASTPPPIHLNISSDFQNLSMSFAAKNGIGRRGGEGVGGPLKAGQTSKGRWGCQQPHGRKAPPPGPASISVFGALDRGGLTVVRAPRCMVICDGGFRTLEHPTAVVQVPVASAVAPTDTTCYPPLFLLGSFLISRSPGCPSISVSLPLLDMPLSSQCEGEVTTGCGHRTKKRCHFPESRDWSFLHVLPPSLLPGDC